jgi:hypothetical protein
MRAILDACKEKIAAVIDQSKAARSLGAGAIFSAGSGGLKVVENNDTQASIFRYLCVLMGSIGVIAAILTLLRPAPAKTTSRRPQQRGSQGSSA